jgi:hypothetical protein
MASYHNLYFALIFSSASVRSSSFANMRSMSLINDIPDLFLGSLLLTIVLSALIQSTLMSRLSRSVRPIAISFCLIVCAIRVSLRGVFLFPAWFVVWKNVGSAFRSICFRNRRRPIYRYIPPEFRIGRTDSLAYQRTNEEHGTAALLGCGHP